MNNVMTMSIRRITIIGSGFIGIQITVRAIIDRGELGAKSGTGFYDWKNPEFARHDFLKPGKPE